MNDLDFFFRFLKTNLRRWRVVSGVVEAAVGRDVEQTEHGSLVSAERAHALAAVKVPTTHRTVVRTCTATPASDHHSHIDRGQSIGPLLSLVQVASDH